MNYLNCAFVLLCIKVFAGSANFPERGSAALCPWRHGQTLALQGRGQGIICLPGIVASEHALPMESPASNQTVPTNQMSLVKFVVLKSVMIISLCTALGLAQAWMASWSYQPNRVAGFPLGLWHGMLMPAALPGLLMGQDLPIYARNNTGRTYNIGYAMGINGCGLLFFSIAFWRPRGWRWSQAYQDYLASRRSRSERRSPARLEEG